MAAVAETSSAKRLGSDDFPIIEVSNPRETLTRVAARFWGEPTKGLFSFGVTGTNGKTTVSWIVAEALARLTGGCAHIGTLGYRCVQIENGKRDVETRDSRHTTPEAPDIHSYLSECAVRGVRAASLEASSHGVVQKRTSDINWDCVLFTNLTHDHLDFHGTLEEYKEAKFRLFSDELAKSSKERKIAIVNGDDPVGLEYLARLKKDFKDIEPHSFCRNNSGDASALLQAFHCANHGTELTARILGETVTIRTRLIGDYNVSNTLCSALALAASGFKLSEIAQVLSEVDPVPGRLELVAPAEVSVYVDYAHTPDALVRAQSSVREITKGRLITVFGCGGDRDRKKRPEMGRVVAESSEFCVVTSDNPRTEAPEAIINDVLPGIRARFGTDQSRYAVVVDRRQAIRQAIEMAKPGDTVLIAGKGHEGYQEINGVRYPFSDREESERALVSAHRV